VPAHASLQRLSRWLAGLLVVDGRCALTTPKCDALAKIFLYGVGHAFDGKRANGESAKAIGYWWAVTCSTIALWRKALGGGRMDSEGSRRLIQAAVDLGAAKIRGKKLSSKQVERRRQTAKALNLGQYLQLGYHGPMWTRKQLALLGKDSDSAIGRKIGRTRNAVRVMRTRLGIPNPCDGRRKHR